VLEDLKEIKRCWFYKAQEVSRRGIPDVIICCGGQFIALELKVDSPIDALQEYNITKIKRSGGLAYVATPDNWKELLTLIKERKWK
jgi:hypothetical protein